MEELFEILEKDLNPMEIIELLNEFDREKLITYAVKNNICPKCCSQLKVHGWKESRGDYFGFPSYEEMFELRCNDCGWIDE